MQILSIRARKARRKLRDRLRAARILHSRGDPAGHFRTFNSMVACRLESGRSSIAGVSPDEYEVCLRQKLVQSLMSSGFLGELSRHAAAPGAVICAPVPAEWRRELSDSGVAIARLTSMIVWRWTVMRAWVAGLRRAAKLLLHSWSAQDWTGQHEQFLVLPGLSEGNLPSASPAAQSRRDFLAWTARLRLRNGSQEVRAHVPGSQPQNLGERVFRVSEVFPPHKTISRRVKFAAEAAVSCFLAMLDLLLARWQRPWLLADQLEALYASTFRWGPSAQFVFCNPNFQYRPLWTYPAAKDGSKIAFAFYSTNFQFMSTEDQSAIPLTPGYATMSWPSYLVWDEYQELFVRDATRKSPDIRIVGSIDFVDDESVIQSPSSGQLSCAVFDVTAFQPLIAADRGMLDPYYTLDIVKAFLDDVSEGLANAGVAMYYKRKRPFIRIAATSYRKHVQRLVNHPNVTLVSPETSASRLAHRCDMVISIPYTSTAIVGKVEGRPSVFYDPTGKLPDDVHLAHGIPVLRGKAELANWIAAQKSDLRR